MPRVAGEETSGDDRLMAANDEREAKDFHNPRERMGGTLGQPESRIVTTRTSIA